MAAKIGNFDLPLEAKNYFSKTPMYTLPFGGLIMEMSRIKFEIRFRQAPPLLQQSFCRPNVAAAANIFSR